VFEVPVTLAVKVCVPYAGAEALVGLTLNKTAIAATIVTLAEADLVGSATLFAVTVTTGDEGTLAGATYSPLAEIVPHAASAQPAPLTVRSRMYLKSHLHSLRTVEYLPSLLSSCSGLP